MGWGGYDYPSLLPSHVLGDRPWNGRRAGVRLGLGSSHLACVLPMDHFSGQTLALGADRLTIGQFRTPRVRKSRQHPVGTRGLWNPGNSLRKGGCLPPTPQSLLVSGPPLGLGSWVTTGDKQAWHSLLDKLLSPDLSCLSTVRLSAGLQTPALRAQLLPIAVAHLLHPFIPPPTTPWKFLIRSLHHCLLHTRKGRLPRTSTSYPSGLQAVSPNYICLGATTELADLLNTGGSG